MRSENDWCNEIGAQFLELHIGSHQWLTFCEIEAAHCLLELGLMWPDRNTQHCFVFGAKQIWTQHNELNNLAIGVFHVTSALWEVKGGTTQVACMVRVHDLLTISMIQLHFSHCLSWSFFSPIHGWEQQQMFVAWNFKSSLTIITCAGTWNCWKMISKIQLLLCLSLLLHCCCVIPDAWVIKNDTLINVFMFNSFWWQQSLQ